MTSNQPIGGNTETGSPAPLSGVKLSSTIVLLAGIWFFISPWVYGAYTNGSAWNSWIVGALLFIFGCIRVARPVYSTALSWVNMALGIWVFFSPWIYGYVGNSERFINSLCVGVIAFVFAIVSARLATRTNAVPVSRL